MPPGCGLRVMLSERPGFVAVPNCENDNQKRYRLQSCNPEILSSYVRIDFPWRT